MINVLGPDQKGLLMRQLRRKDRKMEIGEAAVLLASCEYGILSTVDENGQPYGVPLNYVFNHGAIYFHSALAGHKLDNLKHNPRVSFTVVGKTHVHPDQFATDYESVIAFGSAEEVAGDEKEQALVWLLEKYSSGHMEQGKNYIRDKWKATLVIKIEVESFTGKARR